MICVAKICFLCFKRNAVSRHFKFLVLSFKIPESFPTDAVVVTVCAYAYSEASPDPFAILDIIIKSASIRTGRGGRSRPCHIPSCICVI